VEESVRIVWGCVMINYPRKVSSVGTERGVCGLMIQSKLNTCGTLVLSRRGGASPNWPSPNPPHEYYIYLDGTTTLTPRIGGVTQFTTTPSGGGALGAATVPQTLWDGSRVRGITTYGSERQASSVKVCGPAQVTVNQNLPAFGIMYSAASAVMYFYVTEPAGALCYGDETAWSAGSATNLLGTSPAGSGSLGNYRDGRTVFGNDDGGEALVIESGGKSGALILASGDHTTAVALYIDATNTPKFDTAQNWLTYALS